MQHTLKDVKYIEYGMIYMQDRVPLEVGTHLLSYIPLDSDSAPAASTLDARNFF